MFFEAVTRHKYVDLCLKHNLHPVAYAFKWTSFQQFQKTVLYNPFFKTSLPVWWTLWIASVRIKTTFRRCLAARIIARRVSKNTTDFDMTPLACIPRNHLFHVCEEGSKYTFTIHNFLKLVITALTKNVEMISSPSMPVNPYTRRLIHPNTIYRFYLALRETPLRMHPLLLGFISCNCNLIAFLIHNECQLREFNILSVLNSMGDEEAQGEIRHMLLTVRAYHLKSTIIPNAGLLPVKCLLQFKPWLVLFMEYEYSLNPYKRSTSYANLARKMVAFKADNPDFGSKINGVVCTTVTSPVKQKLPPSLG